MSTDETILAASEVDREPAPFTQPQFGIFAQGTHAHRFLELDLKPGSGYYFAPSLNALNDLAGKD